jgi:hypothetical protein
MNRKTASVIFLIQSLAAPALADTPSIGTTVAVKNEVAAESGGSRQPLFKGVSVHQNEVIVTGQASSAELEFLDKTKLAVGPEARIVLDKFVFDASTSQGSISVNLSKGAFRFLTGIAPKDSYEIKTPTASLGVRGTIFDIFVGGNGETAVLLLEGAVQVCNLEGTCQLQDKLGTLFFVSTDGAISSPSKCDNSFLRGIRLETAFPFVGQRLVIDPVRRMSSQDFECEPANKEPLTPTKGVTPPSPPSGGGTELLSPNPPSGGVPGVTQPGGGGAGLTSPSAPYGGTPGVTSPSGESLGTTPPSQPSGSGSTFSSPAAPSVTPPDVLGFVIAGGLIIGAPIIESRPVSP